MLGTSLLLLPNDLVVLDECPVWTEQQQASLVKLEEVFMEALVLLNLSQERRCVIQRNFVVGLEVCIGVERQVLAYGS